MEHRAKKSMGQNFLKNKGVILNICKAANLSGDDTVLEIGPGQGALTGELVKGAGKVIAIEKDDNLFAGLQEKFAGEIEAGKLELIHGDIMHFDAGQKLKASSYKLVANIPYNLTGAIIEKFLSAECQSSMMVLLVQKEVAERMVAKDKKTGNAGKESILSIAVKVYGTPIYMGTVKAGSFVPAPKVDSAIIKIEGISRANFPTKHHEQVFFQLVKTGFAHKRKTLAGNLKNIFEPEIVESAIRAAGLRPAARAEDLSISDWITLMNVIYNATYR